MTSVVQRAGESVFRDRIAIAAMLVEREFACHPELARRYGERGREKSLQDAGYHLAYLAQALTLDSEALFVDYVVWAKVMLVQRKVLSVDLAFHLECLADVLCEQLPGEQGARAGEFVRAAVHAMPAMPEDLPSLLDDGAPLSPLAHQYLEALRRGERALASQLILRAVASGTSVKEIYLRVFQPVQREIGRLWQTNRMTVAQEHYCTAATQMIVSQLYPHIFASKKTAGTLVATCVAARQSGPFAFARSFLCAPCLPLRSSSARRRQGPPQRRRQCRQYLGRWVLPLRSALFRRSKVPSWRINRSRSLTPQSWLQAGPRR